MRTYREILEWNGLDFVALATYSAVLIQLVSDGRMDRSTSGRDQRDDGLRAPKASPMNAGNGRPTE